MGKIKTEEIKCVNNRGSKEYMLNLKPPEDNIKVHDCTKGGASGHISLKDLGKYILQD